MIDKEKLFERYYKEWVEINQYVNDIDKGYAQNITIFASVATIATTIIALLNKEFDKSQSVSNIAILLFLIPIAFLICFGFLGYQFRITAILRGHMAYLEKEMNNCSGKNIYMWNSILTDTYMAKRNVSNKFLMVPISFFVLVTCAVCFAGTYKYVHTCSYIPLWVLIAYWCVIFILGIIIFIPFLRNDKFRIEIANNTEVMKNYIETYIKYTYKEVKKCSVKTNNSNCDDINIKIILKKTSKKQKDIENSIRGLLNRILLSNEDRKISVLFVKDFNENN